MISSTEAAAALRCRNLDMPLPVAAEIHGRPTLYRQSGNPFVLRSVSRRTGNLSRTTPIAKPRSALSRHEGLTGIHQRTINGLDRQQDAGQILGHRHGRQVDPGQSLGDRVALPCESSPCLIQILDLGRVHGSARSFLMS
jgi:hypothetical protein